MKAFSLVIAVFLLSVCSAWGQTSKEKMFATPSKNGGVYYAYPEPKGVAHTAPPKGYEPFYISHYGRHGSRYLLGDGEYKWTLDLLADAGRAGVLTPLGKDVLRRLKLVWTEAEGQGGALTPLGVRQQRGIAERMYRSYPQVFDKNLPISARSTIVVRCVLTMDAFCERLKELDPTLQITRESSDRYMSYLNYHTPEAIRFCAQNGPWHEEYEKFKDAHFHPQRLTTSLFADKEFIRKKVNLKTLMWNLYEIAIDMQNMETKVSFYDLFTPQELFDLWQFVNYHSYLCDATSPDNGGIMPANSKTLLRNVVDSADAVIRRNGKGLTLRFGHDGNIIPFVALMHFKDCYNQEANPDEVYKAWSNYKIVPMAANVQIVFFRKKKSEDILVKFMLNEHETAIQPLRTDLYPFYHWKDVKKYFEQLLGK